MGLIINGQRRSRLSPSQPPVKENSPESSDIPKLDITFGEIDVVLRALSTSHFPVKDIDVLYTAIYKLQELRQKIANDTQN